jgi:6-phosphogluconolactonase
VTLHRFPDCASLVRSLADEIAGWLGEAVAARGAASLVVPGGSTPGPLFDALAGKELLWSAITVTLNDERWVDPADPASNERLVRERLLTGCAAEAGFVGLKTAAATARDGLAEVEARLAAIARPFDVMLLGMGADSHTASLFPGSAALAASLDGDGRARRGGPHDPGAADPARRPLHRPDGHRRGQAGGARARRPARRPA